MSARELVWRRRLDAAPMLPVDWAILIVIRERPHWNGSALLTLTSIQDGRDGELMLTAQLMRARASRDCILGVNDVLLGGALEPCAVLEGLERFI